MVSLPSWARVQKPRVRLKIVQQPRFPYSLSPSRPLVLLLKKDFFVFFKASKYFKEKNNFQKSNFTFRTFFFGRLLDRPEAEDVLAAINSDGHLLDFKEKNMIL